MATDRAAEYARHWMDEHKRTVPMPESDEEDVYEKLKLVLGTDGRSSGDIYDLMHEHKSPSVYTKYGDPAVGTTAAFFAQYGLEPYEHAVFFCDLVFDFKLDLPGRRIAERISVNHRGCMVAMYNREAMAYTLFVLNPESDDYVIQRRIEGVTNWQIDAIGGTWTGTIFTPARTFKHNGMWYRVY